MPGLMTIDVTITVKQYLALVTAQMPRCMEERAAKCLFKGLQVCNVHDGLLFYGDAYSCCKQLTPMEQI